MLVSKHRAATPYVEVLASTKVAAPATETLEALGRIGGHMAWAIPLASATVSGIATAAERMTAASRKANAFKSMLQANPHLATIPPEDSQRYFNVLYTMNPDFAKEPTVAGSFVMHQHEVGRNPMAPHSGAFEAALKLRGGGGMNGPRPGSSIGNDLTNAAKGVQGVFSEADRVKKEHETFSKKVDTFHMNERNKELSEREKKMDAIHRSLQNLSAQAAHFESLLDQHGIPH